MSRRTREEHQEKRDGKGKDGYNNFIRGARGLLLLSFSVVPLVLALVIISTTYNLIGEIR